MEVQWLIFIKIYFSLLSLNGFFCVFRKERLIEIGLIHSYIAERELLLKNKNQAVLLLSFNC